MNLHAEPGRRGGALSRHMAMAGLLALAGWGLPGCDGGNDDEAGVTSMVANNARYSRVATVTISGRNLQAGITMQMEGGCENLTRVAGGTDETQQYTCEVAAVGEHVATVYSRSGAFLGSLTFQVPQPQVSLTTSKGVITLDLDAVNSPVTTRNFLNYVGSGFYRNVLVHRAIPARGLVSGGYTTGLVAKAPTQPAIKLESNNGLKNMRGALGMVRGDAFDSATSQWYINTADNPDLDYVDAERPGYAVFGNVLAGLDVADAITAVETRSDPATGLTDVPVVEILITAASQTR